MLACNHCYSLVDPALLVLMGGCLMVSVRLWNNQVRTIDPFLSPQGVAWQLLTCLSASHAHRDVEGVVGGGDNKGTAGEGERACGNKKEDGKDTGKQESGSRHLKHD